MPVLAGRLVLFSATSCKLEKASLFTLRFQVLVEVRYSNIIKKINNIRIFRVLRFEYFQIRLVTVIRILFSAFSK